MFIFILTDNKKYALRKIHKAKDQITTALIEIHLYFVC